MEIKDKVQKIMQHYDLNPSSLGRKIGKSNQTIRNMIDRDNKPSYHVIQALLQAFPEINADWLLRNDAEMFKKEKPVAQVVPDRKLLETLYYTIDLQRQKLRELGKLFDVSVRQFSFSLSM